MNRRHHLPYFILSMLIWTSWSVFMLCFPDLSTTESYSRSMARICALLLPSVLFLWYNPEFRREYKPLTAMLVGVSLSVGFYFIQHLSGIIPNEAVVPTSGAIWQNWIIGSPFAEELFFRGIVLRQELKCRSVGLAILISSICFTVFHVPPWVIVEQQSVLELMANCIPIISYGVVFGIIYWLVKSIWATFIPHATNNLIAQLINPL